MPWPPALPTRQSGFRRDHRQAQIYNSTAKEHRLAQMPCGQRPGLFGARSRAPLSGTLSRNRFGGKATIFDKAASAAPRKAGGLAALPPDQGQRARRIIVGVMGQSLS